MRLTAHRVALFSLLPTRFFWGNVQSSSSEFRPEYNVAPLPSAVACVIIGIKRNRYSC